MDFAQRKEFEESVKPKLESKEGLLLFKEEKLGSEIVRMEFGLNNKVFEENEFLEEIFQIASIDYTYEHDMIRQKYQRLAEPVKSVNSFPTAHEILTKNKHKSMVKISPRNSSQKGKTSTFGQNSQSVNTLINGNKSVAHFRQSSIV